RGDDRFGFCRSLHRTAWRSRARAHPAVAMAEKQPNLYEVLGVAHDAKLTDIGRAYNKYKASLAKDTTMPDHRRARRMDEAFATLSDAGKRSQYDASLNVTNRKREGVRGVVFAVVIVIG